MTKKLKTRVSSEEEESSQNSNGTKEIPFDVIVDGVLRRSRVKSLLRIRSVSKQWRHAISENRFVRRHFIASFLSDRWMLLVKGILNEDSTPACYFTLDFDDQDDAFQFSAKKLGFPSHSVPSRIIGSTDGVILVAFSDEDKLALWNPSARTYRYFHCACATYYGYPITGFCYDSYVDDYIAIFGTVNGNNRMSMSTYSFRTGMWNHMSKKGVLVEDGCGEGITVNGVSHWIMSDLDKSKRLIVCYDLVKKRLKKVPMPDRYFLDFRKYHLSVLRGNLCVYSYGAKGLSGWVMKEYFVEKSWTLVFTLSNLPHVPFGFHPKPLFLTSKGYIVVSVSRDELVLYDRKGKKTRASCRISLPDASVERVEAVFLDSLVVPTVRQMAMIHG